MKNMQAVLNFPKKYLDQLTMYRVVLYGLGAVSVVAIIEALFGWLPFDALNMFFSLMLLCTVSYGVNWVCSRLLRIETAYESWLISALILFLILMPPTNLQDVFAVIFIAALAQISKYVLVLNSKHVFNPVAIALVIASAMGIGIGSWWVASLPLLWIMLPVGIAIASKVQRLRMFIAFSVVALVSIYLNNSSFFSSPTDFIVSSFASWPIIFFGAVMLTEPRTSPTRWHDQLPFAILVGTLFGSSFHVGPIFASPELALVLGNIVAFLFSPQPNIKLSVVHNKRINGEMYELAFEPSRKLDFTAGQYLEWTLPHSHPDNRGNRRYFTIASAPEEKQLLLGVKIPTNNPSSYKSKLRELKPGDTMIAGDVSGDFVLPKDINQKLVFIAGGVGITPFRSMVAHLLETNQKRDIHLLYAVSKPEDIMYANFFEQAQHVGLKLTCCITQADCAPPDWNGKTGYITGEMLSDVIVDWQDRSYYLSGPPGMLQAYITMLQKVGVPGHKIKTDFFPGY